MRYSEVFFLNGKFISKGEAKLPLLSPGFLYGWGLFETLRAYNNQIVYFDAHLERIRNACQLIDLKLSLPLIRLKVIIKKAVRMSGFKDAYVRLTLSKAEDASTNIFVRVKKYQPYSYRKYKEGFRACIYPFRQNEDSLLTQLKTTNHLFYQLAYQQARQRHYDEAIILNNRGYICEASRSNIFLVKDKTLFSPSLECGCLAGITRKVIFDFSRRYQIKIYAGRFDLGDLYTAQEAFLTNSLIGVMPLVSVERKSIGSVTPGKVTEFFIKEYNLLLKQGKAKFPSHGN